ncbi:hypothetical protein H8E07_10085 [bacterium]|nr:hypothetical protein [bacterium]
MTTRPILFSGEMVRAILDGRKTQTRRILKPKVPWRGRSEGGHDWIPQDFCDEHGNQGDWVWAEGGDTHEIGRCPHGIPRDRLYVKEAAWMWCANVIDGTTPTGRPKHRYIPIAKVPPVFCATSDKPTEPPTGEWPSPYLWRYKTARFLPRWASRITLEVTGVRVERVGEISAADASAEGCGTVLVFEGERTPLLAISGEAKAADVARFRALWDSLNAARGFGWDTAPWVWVVEFQRVDR